MGSVREEGLSLCASLIEAIRQDCLNAETETCSKESEFRNKSTVGLMLSDTVIDAMVFGGPAYNSGKLERGDKILKVDNELVTYENIHDAILGGDIPGTQVTVTVLKQSEQNLDDGTIVDVTLKRMASDVIADRRRMFELFTLLKERASKNWDAVASETTDECIQLWTKMLIASGKHDDTIARNVRNLQSESARLVMDLEDCFHRLDRNNSSERGGRERAIAPGKSNDDWEAELSKLKQDLEMFQGENARKDAELLQAQNEIGRLKKLFETMIPLIQYESALDDVKQREAEILRLKKVMGTMVSKAKVDELQDEVVRLREESEWLKQRFDNMVTREELDKKRGDLERMQKLMEGMVPKAQYDSTLDLAKNKELEIQRLKKSIEVMVSKVRYDEALSQSQLLAKDVELLKQRLQAMMKSREELLALKHKLGEAGLSDSIVLDRLLNALKNLSTVDPLSVAILIEKLRGPPEVMLDELSQLIDVLACSGPILLAELIPMLLELQGPPSRSVLEVRRVIRAMNDPVPVHADDLCQLLQLLRGPPPVDIVQLQRLMKMSISPEDWLELSAELQRLRLQLDAQSTAVPPSKGGDKVAGIGMLIEGRDGGYFYVKSLPSGGVAERSGKIQLGDLLIAVDQQSLHGFNTERALGLIAGAEGTRVELTLKRGGEMGQEYRVTLVRSCSGFASERFFVIMRKVCTEAASLQLQVDGMKREKLTSNTPLPIESLNQPRPSFDNSSALESPRFAAQQSYQTVGRPSFEQSSALEPLRPPQQPYVAVARPSFETNRPSFEYGIVNRISSEYAPNGFSPEVLRQQQQMPLSPRFLPAAASPRLRAATEGPRIWAGADRGSTEGCFVVQTSPRGPVPWSGENPNGGSLHYAHYV